eukprot:CAMPEP_0119101644 /NCGR_PEP_ID=MMETSP1180-20130426/640_1 /TAXON_ID=3052 ORGANISM="Chlamydomonas cf sp, Strain CCMP681" /NCGR_SAMPLE_ID=MMETSP1180 /ASSEMBLY_ACC=CAM_ASM_000741 /LENGTH=817 /DNA_ID=CAMNT_0007085795 /DNA_START=20 /DNA_END=2473 /DNA_ORIENTATION=-
MTEAVAVQNGAPNDSTAMVVVSGTEPVSSTAMVPAGDVRTAGFDLKAIQKLATQTKAIGVILPPPDIRAIVDKTASFVAKHGSEFERRILENEKSNAKFGFLVLTDPYHAYYQMRIKNFKDELGGAGTKEQGPAAAAQEAKLGALAAQAIPHALAKLDKPEDEMYTVHVPEGLQLQDLDFMKLTAQFVARNGKNFLTGLAAREHTNPQFSFLRPTHSLFGFFTSLCDAYSRVLMPPKGTKERLAKDAADSAVMLERSIKRLEWDKVREREMKDAEDEAERERQSYQSVDWHDFVVVETIEFFEDEDEDLPPPLTLKDVINMNKAREYAEAEEQQRRTAAAAAGLNKPAVVMSEEERALVAQAAAVSIQPPTMQPPSTQPPPAQVPIQVPVPQARPQPVQAAPPVQEVQETEMEMEVSDEEDGPMRVVRDYVRPATTASAMLRGQAYDPTKFAVSPITGELVAIADMAEHMRVSLIDPRWKEQREAMLSKIRDNTRASDDEISRNLVNLAGTRPDIFGSTDQEVTQLVSESIRDKLTSGANRPVAWDGVTQKGPELANQLANIQQNRAQLAGQQGPRPPPPRPTGPSVPPPGPPPTIGAVAAARQAQMAAMQNAGLAPPSGAVPGPPGNNFPRPPGLPAMPPPPPRPPGFPMPPGAGPLRPPPPMPPMHMPPMHMPPPGPPGMMRPPLMPREAPPPMPSDQPDLKRPRLGEAFVLQPEEEFLAHHAGASKVRVQCPEVEGNDKLIGQLLEVEVASLQDTLGDFKDRLSSVLGVAGNKIKLSRDGVGFLRDEPTLAHYNVAPDVVLMLALKERTRGKKA